MVLGDLGNTVFYYTLLVVTLTYLRTNVHTNEWKNVATCAVWWWYDVIEAHGNDMRFRLTIASFHVAIVQFVRRFDREGLHQLQKLWLRARECLLSSI